METNCRPHGRWSMRVALALMVVMPLAGGGVARADAPVDDELHLQATFSFWATSVNGDYALGDFDTSMDVCFSELIKDADYAFNPGAELTKGNWLLAFNATISKVGDTTDFRFGGSVDTDITIQAYSLMIGYTAYRKHYDNGQSLTFTPAAGAQLSSLDGELNPANFPARSNSITFVDPVIGGRIVWGLSREVAWRTEATIGGFGVGSELTWSAGTYIDWQFAKSWALSGGYRALSWDYDLGPGETDLTLHGPWVGLTWSIF